MNVDLAICSHMLSCFLTTSHMEKMRFLHYLCYIDEYIDIRQCLLEHVDEIQSITRCTSSTAKKTHGEKSIRLPDFVAKQNILNFVTALI